MANPFKKLGTRLGPLPESAVKNQNKKSANNKKNKEQTKSLQKKLIALQSIDKPSGSERAKILALRRRIKGLKNPNDAKTVSQIQQQSKDDVKNKMRNRNTDYQRYKKGDISKEQFIRLHKDSQTAKKANLKIKKKNRKKDYSKEPLFSRLNDALFKDI